MKIVVTEFRQESNSLSPFTSGFDFWRSGWMLSAHEMQDHHSHAETAVRGILEVLAEDSLVKEVIPGPAYYSQSGGTTEQPVMDAYLDELLAVLRGIGEVDAVFISFHGALQTTEFDDAEAEVVRRIREVVGERCVVAASADLHGYISRRSAEQLDVLCGYHTYPHVDFVETGRRAARLGLQILRARFEGKPGPRMAWVPIPMMVSASGYNTLAGPFAGLFEKGRDFVAAGDIVDFSIFQMQPWLDVAEPCSAVLTIGEDAVSISNAAKSLAQDLYQARHDFEPELRTIDEVIQRASRRDTAKPVIIVDSADSPNAGAAGDSMAVAARVAELGSDISLATVVRDPAAIKEIFRAGVGSEVELHLGGGLDTRAITLAGTFHIRSLHDGAFRNAVLGSAGATSDLGRAAVVQMGAMDVLVCEHLVSPGDPQLYAGFGMPQEMYDLVVVKANTSFRAAYQEIAGEVMDADTPGSAGPNIVNLPFETLPKDIYPWRDVAFTPTAHILRPQGVAAERI